jgi:transcriptional regulator with XRE-family HTH domain
MRDLGREVRRLREFVGLSQERLARASGVSQGAVSRLEAGRGLATPLLVAVRIRLALIEALRAVDVALLRDELRQMVDDEHVVTFAVNGIKSDIRSRGIAGSMKSSGSTTGSRNAGATQRSRSCAPR